MFENRGVGVAVYRNNYFTISNAYHMLNRTGNSQSKIQLRPNRSASLADLMDTALLMGTRPDRRALVAIQPETTSWGDAPTPRVANAMERAECEILSLIERWEV